MPMLSFELSYSINVAQKRNWEQPKSAEVLLSIIRNAEEKKGAAIKAAPRKVVRAGEMARTQFDLQIEQCGFGMSTIAVQTLRY